jgi:cation-transporting ATPase 13A1
MVIKPSSNNALYFYRPQTLIQSKSITSASFHNPLPLLWHGYIWPFALVYPIWLYIYLFRFDEYLGSEEWTFVSLGSIVVIQALVFLTGQWSVSIKANFTCTKVSDHPAGWANPTTLNGSKVVMTNLII